MTNIYGRIMNVSAAQLLWGAEAMPELADSIKRSRGRPKLDKPKVLVSLRLDPDVLEKFKATGKGWQSRINEALKAAKV